MKSEHHVTTIPALYHKFELFSKVQPLYDYIETENSSYNIEARPFNGQYGKFLWNCIKERPRGLL